MDRFCRQVTFQKLLSVFFGPLEAWAVQNDPILAPLRHAVQTKVVMIFVSEVVGFMSPQGSKVATPHLYFLSEEEQSSIIQPTAQDSLR